ncbi:MAG: histidinol-phosphatase HisJ family protein [Defluviitaleaceae bacterium]|nr:histidinol-phosphatase HisJ family protein [Defluviitaleaceae bacterium]
MFFDSHVHSMASPDSHMCPKEAITTLKNKGLGIAFTEHVDFSENNNNKDPNASDAIRGLGDFVCDFSIYPRKYEALRGPGVTLGLECGLTKAFLRENIKVANSFDYDFIIGSIHSVDGVELYKASKRPEFYLNEPYAQQLHNPATVDECISRYLTYSREMVEQSNFFHAFGHIDYITRYAPGVKERFLYENFASEFDALLKILTERQIALEINTSRFSDDIGGEIFILCKRFAALGGRLCTIGSDAHSVENLGKSVKHAKRIASEAGLLPVYFKERKPIPCG